MRFLIDANLSPRLVALLEGEGHEAAHVPAVLSADAPDDEVMSWARHHEYVVVSADTDFGELHARAGTRHPSVVLFRLLGVSRASDQAAVLVANLPELEEDLDDGAIVVIEAARIRVRKLPM